MRRWIAGWLSRIGGDLINIADRLSGPLELRQYYIDHHRSAHRAQLDEQMRAQRAGSRWN